MSEYQSVIETTIRVTLGLVVLAGFFSVVYFGTRRFVGLAGKTLGRRTTIFAAANASLLTILLLIRDPLERFLVAALSPLRHSTLTSPSNWPELTAVALFRTVIVTSLLLLIVQAVGRVYWAFEGRLLRRHTSTGWNAHALVFLTALLRVLRYASVVALVLVFLPIVLSLFPRTKVLVDQARGFLAAPAYELGAAVVAYLPNLGYLIVIAIAGYYALKVMHYFFTSIENGTLQVAGFLPEWAAPTYRLLRTLFLIFLLMVTYPYLPGSKSQFFQGFSVFLGALITFGSTATIGNIVSGTVLTYTRAFKIGDMVTIGDKTGVVMEKTLLVTRLVTPLNEEVSIPNGSVLSMSILNFSARASDGLILTVKAGIGYDVDRRTVSRTHDRRRTRHRADPHSTRPGGIPVGTGRLRGYVSAPRLHERRGGHVSHALRTPRQRFGRVQSRGRRDHDPQHSGSSRCEPARRANRAVPGKAEALGYLDRGQNGRKGGRGVRILRQALLWRLNQGGRRRAAKSLAAVQ